MKLLLGQSIIGSVCFLGASLWLEAGQPTRYTAALATSLAYQGVVVAGFNFLVNAWMLQLYRPSALAAWALFLLGLGALTAFAGVMRHRFAVFNWLQASFRMAQIVAHHAARSGPAVRAQHSTGEVVATVSNDAMRAGGAFDITARLAGSVVSYLVVAIILLSSSVVLGLVVLVGVLKGALIFLADLTRALRDVDDDRLAQVLGHGRRHGAAHHVGGAARREGHDDVDRLIGEILRRSGQGEERRRQRQRRQWRHGRRWPLGRGR